MDRVTEFAEESVAYFGHFNSAIKTNNEDDACITLPELEEMLPKPFDPSLYCENLYWELYEIDAEWYQKCKLPNCGFDFEGCYDNRIVPGPAFDGEPLFWQTTTGPDEV